MLGMGVYSLSEVRRYTGVPASTLWKWFNPSPDRKNPPIFESDFDRVDDDFAVSFLNLIEAYVASFFKQQKIKPGDIRRCHDILKNAWGIKHPFAFEDLRTDGRSIIISRSKDSALIDIIKNQMVFETVRPYLLSISYSKTTRLADTWAIAEGVVINPRIGFGKPVVEGAGISTLVLSDQYLANAQDAAVVARMFKVSAQSVINAHDFERSRKPLAA